MIDDRFHVLFVCTANACRSQMAEALLRHRDSARFRASSAGAHPIGFIHPLATETMAAMCIPMDGQHSKSWAAFENEPIDLIITLCDSAAAELCPQWSNPAPKVHWPIEDPVAHPGTDDDRRSFALQTARRLQHMIDQLSNLDVQNLPRHELTRRMDAIGLA